MDRISSAFAASLFFIHCMTASIAIAQTHETANDLQSFVDRQALAGAVTLVATKDAILDIDTVGWADIEARKAMEENSMFWIASQSKPITAAALMILVDQGKVDLNAPIEKYLPEFKGRWLIVEQDEEHQLLKRPTRAITVHDVLAHVSGLPFATAVESPTLDGLPLSRAVASYTMIPLVAEPGTRYQYSNIGINIAGRIIEVVSGKPYEEFLQDELFTPLEMHDTTFWPNEEQVSRLAKSYHPNEEKNNLVPFQIGQLHYPLTDRAHRFPMPAGGLFSTAKDVARFCQMILNDGEFNGKRYLSAESVRAMTTRQTPEGIKENYGLGWQTFGSSAGHGGAHSTNMTIDRQNGRITIYMIQHAGFPLDGGEAQNVFNQAAIRKFNQPSSAN
ncbi:serine hydrolase domain-containing protein [Planctomicrobium sp. SH668]|uniref:serine hydrolase domain-containing protein n=1 Tax=Planctomicrobium sp. SH668 TaxID=3448126 RepID=UPI003F5B6D69